MGPPAPSPLPPGATDIQDVHNSQDPWAQVHVVRRPCGHLRPSTHASFEPDSSFDTVLPSLPNVRDADSWQQSKRQHPKKQQSPSGVATKVCKEQTPTFLCPDDHRQYLNFRNRIAPAHLCAELLGAVMSVVGFCIGFPGCLACIVSSCSIGCAACTSVHFSLTLYLTLVCVASIFSMADLAALIFLVVDRIQTSDCNSQDDWSERQRRLQQGSAANLDAAGCVHAWSVMEWWPFSIGVIVWCMAFATFLVLLRVLIFRKVRILLNVTPRKMKQVLVPKAGIRLVTFRSEEEPQVVIDKGCPVESTFTLNDDDGGVLRHVTDDDMRRAARSIQTSARGFVAARRLRQRRALAAAAEKALKTHHRKAMRSIVKRAEWNNIEMPVVDQCRHVLAEYSSARRIQAWCRSFVAQRSLSRRREIVERLDRAMALRVQGNMRSALAEAKDANIHLPIVKQCEELLQQSQVEDIANDHNTSAPLQEVPAITMHRALAEAFANSDECTTPSPTAVAAVASDEAKAHCPMVPDSVVEQPMQTEQQQQQQQQLHETETKALPEWFESQGAAASSAKEVASSRSRADVHPSVTELSDGNRATTTMCTHQQPRPETCGASPVDSDELQQRKRTLDKIRAVDMERAAAVTIQRVCRAFIVRRQTKHGAASVQPSEMNTPRPGGNAWDDSLFDSSGNLDSPQKETQRQAQQGQLHASSDEGVEALFDLSDKLVQKARPQTQSFDFFDGELGLESWESSCNSDDGDRQLSWKLKNAPGTSGRSTQEQAEMRSKGREEHWHAASKQNSGTVPPVHAAMEYSSSMIDARGKPKGLMVGLRPAPAESMKSDPHQFIRQAM